MAYSNLIDIKSLRIANFFLLALTSAAIIILMTALFFTHYGLLIGFCTTAWFTTTILNSTFLLAALWGAIFIYLGIFCWRQNNNNGWPILVGGYLSTLIVYFAKIIHLITLTNVSNLVALTVWLYCLASVSKAILKTTQAARAGYINLLLTILLPVLFIILAEFFLILTIIFHPKTDDQLLMAIDATLGIYPSFLAGQFFAHLPISLIILFKLIYLGLPFLLAVVYVGRYYQEKKPPLEIIVEFFLIGLGGMLLYHITAGCGPINAFKTMWPQHLPTAPLHPLKQLCSGPFLPRNCLPSLHTAWAVCLWRHSLRCNKTIKIIIAFCCIGTLLATMGLGEHYLVDLIMGFAFAAFIAGICAISLPLKQTARRQAIFGGGLLCITWYLLINFGLDFLRLSPIIAWFCYLASLYLTGKLELKLMRAQRLISTQTTT